MNLLTTFAGSMMEGFLPAGWDLARIDACCSNPPESIGQRQPFWHPDFELIPCATVADFDVMLGHEIATAIRRTRDHGRAAALILPVGPMGMYRWAVYFLKEWNIPCDHVHGFNMDEWSDRSGATLPARQPGRVPVRDAEGVLRAARVADRPRVSALVRHGRSTAPLRRPDRRAAIEGGRADRDLRHRPGLPHRVLGASLRGRVRQAGRLEGPDAPPRREAASR